MRESERKLDGSFALLLFTVSFLLICRVRGVLWLDFEFSLGSWQHESKAREFGQGSQEMHVNNNTVKISVWNSNTHDKEQAARRDFAPTHTGDDFSRTSTLA